MTEKRSINIVKKADHDWDPSLIMQTGFEVYDITVINMLLQTAASATASIGDINNKTTYLDNVTDFVLPAASANDFPSIGDGQGLPFMQCLERLTAQAWTMIRSVAYNGNWLTWPTLDIGEAHCSVFRVNYEEFKQGLFHKHPMAWGNNSGVATEPIIAGTSADHIATGLDWDGIDMTPDLDDHFGLLNRYAYVFGLSMADKFPDLSVRIEATNNATVLERNIQALFLLFYPTMCDYYYLCAAQSDVAMFNIAALEEDLISKKVPSEIANAVDAAWYEFVKTSKTDILGANMKTTTGTQVLNTYTGDFITHSLVDGTTLDVSIDNWKSKGMVSSWALEKARRLWGVGKYEKNGETIHFCNLFNGVIQNTGFTSHGVSTWELGLNLSILYDYMKNKKELVRDYLAFVKKKSYTWTDITAIYEGWFTEFSVLGSLKGYADAEAYRPLRRTIKATDHPADSLTAPIRSSLCSSATTEAFGAGNNVPTQNQVTLGAEWVLLFLNEYVEDIYRMYMPYDWDEAEIYNAFWYGMMFDSGDAEETGLDEVFDADMNKWNGFRMRLVQIVESKQPDKVVCLASSKGMATPKWEDVKDVLTNTNIEDTTAKYSIELVDRVPPANRIYCQHRPKGWKDAPHVYIEDVGHKDVAQQLLINSMGLQSSSKSGSTTPPAQKPTQEVGPNDEGDGPSGEEV